MKKLIYAGMALMLFVSCSKYEDGPDFSMHSKKERLSNSWIIRSAYVNDADRTIDYYGVYRNYHLNIGGDNQYTLSFSPNGIGNYVESGSWDFNGDKTHVMMTSADGKTVDYTILRLQKNDLRVKYTDENEVEWEIHYIPKTTD